MPAAEYEAKVLDVDAGAVTAQIIDAGGTRVGSALLRRQVYDLPGDNKWLRLREDGERVTICVKEIVDDAIGGTSEIEVEVAADFEQADELLRSLGFTPRARQENRRTSFALGGARLELDEWPLIPAYLEIEAGSADAVLTAAAALGYGADEWTTENTLAVYARYGIDLNAVPDLRFDTAPTG